MSIDSIIDIIFMIIFILCSLSMLITTIWFVHEKKKLDRKFIKDISEITKTNTNE